MRFRLLVAIVLAVALTATACSSDSDDTTTTAAPTTTSTSGTTATTSPESALAECVASLVPGSSAVPCEGVVYDLGIPEECFATPCGLIVDFPPSGLAGEQTEAYTNMKAPGNAAGYVVANPNSSRGSFIGPGRDRIFFGALIGALDIDVSRVHVGAHPAAGPRRGASCATTPI